MRIAIPQGGLTERICEGVQQAATERGWTVVMASPDEAGDLLLRNMVDLALTTPLGYGRGVARVDYRIVSGPCVALEDYTNVYGIRFNEGGNGLESFSGDDPTSFLSIAARMVMAEKFDVVLSYKEDNADCEIGYYQNGGRVLDLGEEWFDLVESPLPISFWVARADADGAELDAFVASVANSSVVNEPISELIPPSSDRMPREGRILYRWSSDIQEGLEAALHSLYYHQFLQEIPAVKLYGKE